MSNITPPPPRRQPPVQLETTSLCFLLYCLALASIGLLPIKDQVLLRPLALAMWSSYTAQCGLARASGFSHGGCAPDPPQTSTEQAGDLHTQT